MTCWLLVGNSTAHDMHQAAGISNQHSKSCCNTVHTYSMHTLATILTHQCVTWLRPRPWQSPIEGYGFGQHIVQHSKVEQRFHLQ